MQNIKRERCVNWERGEKILFRSIIRPYLSIIGNKDIKTASNKDKRNAWIEITEKFNAANERHRDKKQLMNQWKGMKMNFKKKLILNRRENFKPELRLRLVSPTVIKAEPEPEIIPEEFVCVDIQEVPIEDVGHVGTESERQESPQNTPLSSKDSLESANSSYGDMHSFRVLENERLQKEHELRIKNMSEIHSQVMINLKLQSEILLKTLGSFNEN